MSVQPAEQLTENEARHVTEQIRSALDRVSTAWAELAERVTEAYQRGADRALGYGSWAEYAEAELKPAEGLAAEVRRELVAKLSAAGMSTRAIAPVVGVTQSAVVKDRARQVIPTESPALAERIDRATGEVLDADDNHRVIKADAPAAAGGHNSTTSWWRVNGPLFIPTEGAPTTGTP